MDNLPTDISPTALAALYPGLSPMDAGNLYQDLFHEMTGEEENFQVIENEVGTSVPDILSDAAIGEIKSGQFVEMTEQLEVQMAYAQAEDIPYFLIVSEETTVSEAVLANVAATGGDVLIFDATAGTLAEYATGAILSEEAVDMLLLLLLI